MIKLLLVEDDANLRYVVQGGLEDIIGGYDVRAAASGEEGLRVWEEFKPDIIITKELSSTDRGDKGFGSTGNK